MVRKILALCMALALVFSVIPTATMASQNISACLVEFYDASANAKINSIQSEKSIYSNVKFTAPSDGDAVIVTAMYNADGTLQSAIPEKAENLPAGEETTYTTTAVTLSNTDSVRVFVWDELNNLVPAASNYGVLENEATVSKYDQKFDVVFENTDKYLYRVGNQNTVALGSLFEAKDGATINTSSVAVTVDKADNNTNVSAEYTANTTDWKQGTIKFSGTGVVKVTIRDYTYCKPTTLYLEVVDAKNITSATGSNGTDVVFLKDVKISSGATVTYENCFVYGNGFTFDARGGLTKYVASQGWGVINLNNGATLDNLVIVGDVYNTFGAYSDNDYNTAAVASLGGIIQNCHISNCAAPVIARGATTVIDSTFYGGTVANMIIKAGINTLENVTTVNYDDNRAITGMGIVIHSDADETTKLVLNGTLKQYNFYSEADVPTDSNAKILYDAMFDSSCSTYHFGTKPNRYVNTGIISMVNTFDDSDISGDAEIGYTGIPVEIQGFNGYVYTQPNTYGSVDNDYVVNNDSHKATVQGDYVPTFEFSLGEQEISYDGDSDSRYMYGDVDGVKALYQDGDDALVLDITKLATIYKYRGINYNVTAKCLDSSGNNLSMENGVVTLSTSGEYTLVFTVEDNIFYDAEGKTVEKTVTREYTVPLSLSVKAADIKDAVITISPTTLEGSYVTVNLTDYKLKLEFLECISVTDYDSAGNGTKVELTSSISKVTFSVPSRTDGNIWEGASVITITYADGRVLTVNLSDFEGSSPGTKTANVVTDSGVYFLTDGALNNKPTEEANKCTCTITSVSFKGNNSATITNDTDVSVSWPLGSKPCVTPDTLVTLADGSQKRIDEVTYDDKLLVWNFYEGKYDAAMPAIIFNHGYDNNTVIKLQFEDGTEVKAVNIHQFFDTTTNKLATITKDTVASFIGHKFAKMDGKACKNVKLVDYEISKEYEGAFGIISSGHYNIITEGMLSADFDLKDYGLFNYFEVGENMTYDAKKMKDDIAKYGLYTYEDFAGHLTPQQFDAFNVKYMKIAVEKGQYTYEGIIELIKKYLNK